MTVARRTGWYLLSSVGAPLISIATLPLFTTRLGPQEFGAFALGTALAGAVTAVSTSFSMVSLPAELPKLGSQERRGFVTAMLVLTMLAAVVSAIIVFTAYVLACRQWGLEWLGLKAVVLLISAALLNSLWGVCVEMHTMQGNARRYAITILIQTLMNVAAVSAALFIFADTHHALFWGFAVAGLVGAMSAILTLRGGLDFKDLAQWYTRARQGSHAAILSAVSENGKILLERSYVSALLGLLPLGILAHAQYYKNAAMIAINALSRGVLPTALEEGHAEVPMFTVTAKLWKLVQAFALCATLGFALVGKQVIGLLTHGKFVDAAPYATALMASLLLQTAAKPHMTLLMAKGKGHLYAHLSTISLVVGMLWLLLSVPYMGVWGVISSVLLQTLIHRVGVYGAANRLHRLPFTDHWVVGGLALSAVCIFIGQLQTLSVAMRITLLLAMYALILWQSFPSLSMIRGMQPIKTGIT